MQIDDSITVERLGCTIDGRKSMRPMPDSDRRRSTSASAATTCEAAKRLEDERLSSKTPTSSTPGSPRALWPHSTLGWPEQTPELAKWYPTSVLLTGRDIITLWVARMVMMGMYNMGEGRLPWHGFSARAGGREIA